MSELIAEEVEKRLNELINDNFLLFKLNYSSLNRFAFDIYDLRGDFLGVFGIEHNYFDYSLDRNNNMYITEMFLKNQNTGLGTRLFGLIKDYSKELGINDLYLIDVVDKIDGSNLTREDRFNVLSKIARKNGVKKIEIYRKDWGRHERYHIHCDLRE